MQDISQLTVHFVVSNELPVIGKDFNCCILNFKQDGTLNTIPTVISHHEVQALDNNIIKVKTQEKNVTYLVMYPSLCTGKLVLGLTNSLPYVDKQIECNTINCSFVRSNLLSISLSDKKILTTNLINKCAKDTYLVVVDNITYILKKYSN